MIISCMLTRIYFYISLFQYMVLCCLPSNTSQMLQYINFVCVCVYVFTGDTFTISEGQVLQWTGSVL